jgi:DNA-binding response OmpR family regulator
VPGTVLIVEDEAKLAEVVRLYLEREGFTVAWAPDGTSALDLFSKAHLDLIILDIMLPGLDGREVCRLIRQESNVPIIMLTARSDERDKIEGLGLGADDYVTKPFSPRELVARAKAALRRAEGSLGPAQSLRVGALVVDLARHQASCQGQPVSLTPAEFKLLAALAQHPGRVFTRSQLLDALGGKEYDVYERTVDVHVKNLRRKLVAAVADESCGIETVHGVGYRLASGAS